MAASSVSLRHNAGMPENQIQSELEKLGPELRLWQRVLLGIFVVALTAFWFWGDRRIMASDKGGGLETVATIIDIALGVVALLALFNIKKIVDWLIKRIADEFQRRGLVIRIQTASKQAAQQSHGNEEPTPERGVAPQIVVEPPPETSAQDPKRLAREERERKRRVARAKRQAWLRKNGVILGVFGPLILVGVCAVFFWPRGGVPTREGDVRSRPDFICPSGCTSDGAALLCSLPADSNPTALARLLLGPSADDVAVARLASQIWEINRTPQMDNDRRIPARTPLRVPAFPQRCEVLAPPAAAQR